MQCFGEVCKQAMLHPRSPSTFCSEDVRKLDYCVVQFGGNIVNFDSSLLLVYLLLIFAPINICKKEISSV